VPSDGVGGRRTVIGLRAGVPLRVRLAAVACCAAAAGAAVMGLACSQAARSGLMSQADQQLRAYADQLTSHPFAAMPAGPGPGGAASGEFVIEVVSANQLVMVTGADGRPGPALSGIRLRGGQLAVVRASSGGGGWLVVSQPVHYTAKRILFTYGSDGYFLHVTSTSRPGTDGTLMVGLDLGSVGHASAEITLTVAAVSAAAVLVIGLAGLAVNRVLLRPLAQAQAIAAAVAPHDLARQVPDGAPGSLAGGLAQSVNRLLSEMEDARMSADAARKSSDQMCSALVGACRELRQRISVVRGCAEYYELTEPRTNRQLDRLMSRIAGEAARINTIIDDLAGTTHGQPRLARRSPRQSDASGPRT
jgi:two-component system, OmpR family, sensor kinase